MELPLSLIMCQCGGKFFGPMDATALDDHDDLFVGFAKDVHDLMHILAQGVCVKMRHDLREDFGGAILDGPNDTEQDATGDAAPRVIVEPRLPFEGFVAFDLTWTQGAGGEARPLGCAPPARAGQGKAPQDRFIFVKHNDVTSACAILQGSEVDGARGKVGRGGLEPSGGTVGAYRVFLNTPRTLSRPRWTPVSRARTAASARQLHWE